MSTPIKDKETKDWKERIKVCDNDWQGLSLFIDEEGVFDEYEAGGVLKDSADEQLKRFIYHEIEQEAERRGYEKCKQDSIDSWNKWGKDVEKQMIKLHKELKLLEEE